jgi:hypothetical protein
MPDPQPNTDQKVGALEDRVSELMRRTDTLIADAAVARVQARKDAAEEPQSGPKTDDGDERLRTLIRDEIRAALKHAVSREGEEAEEGERKEGEPEETAADGGDAIPTDPHHEPLPAWAENPRGRGDARRDLRADAARQQADDNAKLEAQYAYDNCFLATAGEHAPKPVVGMSARSYQTYCLNKLKQYSDDWRDKDLTKLEPNVFALADRKIRADALEVGTSPQLMNKFIPSGALQREIRKTDRTGRVISEFVGPIDAANGMFKPFELPPKKFRNFNRNPNEF